MRAIMAAMRIAVFGANGMLGKAVTAALPEAGHEAVPLNRTDCDVSDPSSVLIAFGRWQFDAVINCAGAIYGAMPHRMTGANAHGPHLLARACSYTHRRLVHVSTDCVFSGAPGEPDRRIPSTQTPDPRDLYGYTKAAGEPLTYKTAVVIRTSFIGRDHGVLAWFLEQAHHGRDVDGWRRAYWTGSTVDAVARSLVNVAASPDVRPGVLHLATREKVSKHDVLVMAKELFAPRSQTTIVPKDEPHVDRALAPDIVLEPVHRALEAMIARKGAAA